MKIVLFNKKSDSSILIKGLFGSGFLKLEMILLFLLIGSYLFQVSQMTKETYAIQTHNAEIERVMEENRNKEYSFLQSNSLSRAKMMIEEMGFERINRVHHIKITEPQVAAVR